MGNISYKELIDKIKEYNPEEVGIITKAYLYAENLHEGQFRQSGEPYITHPLNVAYILAEMHADKDTLCAALLHDVIEDTTATKEEVEKEFNKEIAKLVDGVTKLAKMDFGTKEEHNLANTRKIITSITNDVRIIIIKLADRLHNMRTLEYKTPVKQKEISLETMELFVPIAYYIGAYRIKEELEDLAFSYLKPEEFKRMQERKYSLELNNSAALQEMFYKIKSILNSENLTNEVKLRTKNIYGIYKRLKEFNDVAKIHDLFMLKIIVEEVEDCYKLLYHVHSEYKPLNDMKDYICNPKINMYQSLQSTVFGPNGRLVQAQLRTFDMDRTASFGLTAHWDTHKGDARDKMQQELREKYQFLTTLAEIDTMFLDNQEFVDRVKLELLGEKINVYSPKGDKIELPLGATPIDFAYKYNPAMGNKMIKVLVNDVEVPLDYQLNMHDRVKIIIDENHHCPNENLVQVALTTHARKLIIDNIKRT